MLKIIYPIACGIDVHKQFVVATVGVTNSSGVTDYYTKQFSTFTCGLEELLSWLKSLNCTNVCMESTGKYWIPVFNILESDCSVFVANPKYVKGIRGKKTDVKDSVWLCDLHKHGLVPNSFIPPLPIRQIRDLMRYRCKLISFRSSEKNRIQNSLTVSNIMLASVVSDPFGKSALNIIKYILEHPNDTDFDVSQFMQKNMKSNAETLKKAVNGKLSEPQADKMRTCFQHFDSIDNCIESIEKAALKIVDPYLDCIYIILTLPGISDIFTAIAILGEIGPDMSSFTSVKHLCSWAGLTPQNNESAGKKKSVRVSRAGVYIKPLLIQCANAAIMSKKCNHFKLRYEKIKRKRGHKKAIIAIARMLLTYIYHMISKKQNFEISLHTFNSNFQKPAAKMTEDSALAFLNSLGYNIQSRSASA